MKFKWKMTIMIVVLYLSTLLMKFGGWLPWSWWWVLLPLRWFLYLGIVVVFLFAVLWIWAGSRDGGDHDDR